MVKWVKVGIREGYLLWFTMENTANMVQTKKGREFLKGIIEDINTEAKGTFVLDAPVVFGLHCLMDQNRDRVLIRGAAKRVIVGWEKIPAPLNFTSLQHGSGKQPKFWELLDDTLPNCNRNIYNLNQQKNLEAIEEKLKNGEIHVFPHVKAILLQLCRSEAKAWGAKALTRGYCPTLTQKNDDLFVYSPHDLNKADADKAWFRELKPYERLTLQGLPNPHANPGRLYCFFSFRVLPYVYFLIKLCFVFSFHIGVVLL